MRRSNLYWLIYLFQLAVLLVFVGMLSSCGKIKVDTPTSIDVNHNISIDAETLEQIQILCENNSTTNEETVNCIDQLISAYNTTQTGV
jgi:hypothetical protein